MKNMFFNYDNNIDTSHCAKHHHFENPDIVRDINGNFLGIKAKFQTPITLYFHLTDFGSDYLVTNCLTLANLVMSSDIVFEVSTNTHKVLISKQISAQDCFIANSNDIAVFLDTEDMKNLKQESYKMSLKLSWAEDSYEVFSETDGLLIIR